MSVRRCQSEVDSAEFGEWLALWRLEAEERGETEPTPDQLATKMAGFVAAHSAPRPSGAFLERVK